jgi:SAM-dependent methyltransferase
VTSRAERATSFGAIADDYDRLRPSPPAEAIDWLLPENPSVVVDVGAGTGLLTRALAGRAGHIIAVEPDDRMRAVLQERSPDVEALAGRGESIPLPDGYADAVLIASAWHWMDPVLAIPEIGRVLRDGGRFAVIWAGRDRDAGWFRSDDWFRELARDNSDDASDRQRGHHEVTLPDEMTFRNAESAVFRYSRTMPVAHLIDWLATHSRVITADPAVVAAGLARARTALAEQFPGASEVTVPMRARCWRADRVPREAA